MPMIDITMSRGALDENAKAKLADRLSGDLIELEGAVDNPFVRAITWCFIHEREDIFVGGEPTDKPVYRVVITIPEGVGLYGPLGIENRRTLVKRVGEAVLTAEGTEFTTVEAARVWVHVTQIDDGQWGAFGELVTMPDIVAYGSGGGSADSVGARIRRTMTSILDPGAAA
jgi:phenylpyruvate tautomerase PptA (4-oxalocrotonate tautomerase family)